MERRNSLIVAIIIWQFGKLSKAIKDSWMAKVLPQNTGNKKAIAIAVCSKPCKMKMLFLISIFCKSFNAAIEVNLLFFNDTNALVKFSWNRSHLLPSWTPSASFTPWGQTVPTHSAQEWLQFRNSQKDHKNFQNSNWTCRMFLARRNILFQHS